MQVLQEYANIALKKLQMAKKWRLMIFCQIAE